MINLKYRPDSISVYKKQGRVNVRFALEDCTVHTLEGIVSCSAGDAIITGEFSEEWPVTRKNFERRYSPVSGAMYEDGEYERKEISARAVQLDDTFQINTSGGILQGHKGDWLVQHEDGEFGIVRNSIFDKLYTRG